MTAKEEHDLAFDLGLAVIDAVRKPGERMTLEGIAEVCGVYKETVRLYEVSAMKKLRRRFKGIGLTDSSIFFSDPQNGNFVEPDL